MSRTYRDKININIKKYYKDEYNRWKWGEAPDTPNYSLKHELGITDEILKIHWNKYSKGPNHYHHEFTHRPNRRKAKAAMKRVLLLKDYEDWDPGELPIDGKPEEWFL